MGMFDSLIVCCPICGENVEFQSKGGECILAQYNIVNVPPEVLWDTDDSAYCSCGAVVSLIKHTIISVEVK